MTLQYGCETDERKYSLVAANEAIHTRNFLSSADINMECLQQELSLRFSILQWKQHMTLEAGWQRKKQKVLGTCELRNVYIQLYEPTIECLIFLKTCF